MSEQQVNDAHYQVGIRALEAENAALRARLARIEAAAQHGLRSLRTHEGHFADVDDDGASYCTNCKRYFDDGRHYPFCSLAAIPALEAALEEQP